MTLNVEFQKVVNLVKTYLKNDKELRIWGAAGFVLVLGGGSYYGYQWLVNRWSQKAQIAFSESYDAYNQAIAAQFGDSVKPEALKELWEQAEMDFKYASEHNKYVSFVSFFKAFRAQTLVHQGKREEALKTLREALEKMGSKNPYYGLYQIGFAFLLLEGSQENIEEGLKQLNQVASQDKNTFQDMALYYLGLYYSVSGETQKAVDYWKKIQASTNVLYSKKAESPWVELAKVKLIELGQEKE